MYGYSNSTDGSDFPCFLLWPERSADDRFCLVDSLTSRYFDLESAASFAPIGLEHFFDAFGLTRQRDLRTSASAALRIPVDDILPDLMVRPESASRFHLTPRRVPEVQPAKRAKREETPRSASDVAMGSADRKAAKDSSPSSGSSSSASDSDDSSDDASAEESDLDKLEAAYTECACLSKGLANISHERTAAGGHK